MKKNPRTPRQIVGRFLSSDSYIQCDTISELASKLGKKARRGAVGDMAAVRNKLQKAVRGKKLFEYQEGGQTFYETVSARRRRKELPKWGHR